MGAGPIRDVVVAGSGITAWSAAAALKRQLPTLSVTLVTEPVPADALADRIASTLPSILGFQADLGISEADAVLRAGSGFRLGTVFEGWAEGHPAYVHAYGPYGRAFATGSFHQHWLRLARQGVAAPFETHCAAAMLARAGRFVHPQGEPGSPLSDFEYGLVIDPARYGQMMRAFAQHVGVAVRASGIAGVELGGEDGRIAALRLADGSAIAGDLFVDCTGPAARLRSALDDRFEPWGAWLPCDRILLAESPPPAELPSTDRAVATRAGWRWQAASPVRTAHGIVYAADHIGEDEAAQLLSGDGDAVPIGVPVTIRQGRRSQPWLRNCVAIGDAAVSIEPLEWTDLHLAHSAIDRLVAMMPDRDFAAVELWDYNRQCAAEADRVRDFVALHYRLARRPEPFWQEAAAAEPPPSLAHTLDLFAERGRLPFHEEETFARDSWLAVLIGQGLIPRRTEPLIDSVPAATVEQSMRRMRETIAAIVPALPTQTAYLHNLMRQKTR
jgi:tryptophan halogenase